MMINTILGLLVGWILALTGAGGGILAVPLLVFGAGLTMAQAGPIGLLAVGLAAALGALMGLRAGIVRYKAALLIACAGGLLSPLGLWLAQRLPNRPLSVLFAGVLLWVAYRSYRSAEPALAQTNAVQEQALPCQINPGNGHFIWTFACARAFVLVGSATGFLSGLLGVGGGFVLVPVLTRYTELTQQSVLATSLAVIALVSAAGVLGSALGGNLNWAVGLPFSVGAMAGMLGGRLVSNSMSKSATSRAFAAISALVALGLLVKAVF